MAIFGHGLFEHCQTPPRKTNHDLGNDRSRVGPNCDPFGAAGKAKEIH
jgi:hypothetical protein